MQFKGGEPRCPICGKLTLKPGARLCKRCEEAAIYARSGGFLVGASVLGLLGKLIVGSTIAAVATGLAGGVACALAAGKLFHRLARQHAESQDE